MKGYPQSGQLRILAVDNDHATLQVYRHLLSSEHSEYTPAAGEMEDVEDFVFRENGDIFSGDNVVSAWPLSFELVTCCCGDDAVQAVKQSLREDRPFAVVFMAVRLSSGLDGIEAAEQIRTLDPYVEMIVRAKGGVDVDPGDIAGRIPPVHKLFYRQQPFSPQELIHCASAAAARWQAEHERQQMHEELEQWLEDRAAELICENERLMQAIAERTHCEEYFGQLEQAVEMMQLGVIITDLDGKIIYANHAEATMHGYQLAELLGQEARILVPPELQTPLTMDRIQAWKGLMRESTNLKKDGTRFPVWLMSEILQNARGEPCAVVTSCEDISRRKQVEEALRAYSDHLEALVEARTIELTNTNTQLQEEIEERKRVGEALQKSEERYRTVLETVPNPVVVYDMNGRVTYLNPAFSRFFGWSLRESEGRTIDFIPVEVLPEARTIFTKILRGETIAGIETCRLTRDGRRVDVSLSGAGFFDRSGTVQGSVITFQDITERKQAEEEIHFLAYHDILTGLPNRKSFYIRLEDSLVASRRRPAGERRVSGPKLALLFLDLDKFKNVNDTLGHDIGDELLKIVAGRLRGCLRKSDDIFRLGGDEFTILLRGLTDNTDVAKIAEKIQKNIAQPCHINGHELYTTISIGISVSPDDGDTVENLVKNADMAMYVAKETGQGYHFFTEEMQRSALERMSLESRLRKALQHDQLSMYYQPLVDDGSRIVGMEALLRWNHPELGLISPAKFIPVAEETGTIVPIGAWGLRVACQQVKTWHDMGYTGLYISVNLSPRQFKEPDLVDMVEQALETTGLAPEHLQLEVTESGIMEDPEQAIAKMKRLRAKGIRFSLDDFGTGYSSLSYLKRFPLDTLKIDRSFVMDCISNTDDQEIIKTIIAMAQNLNLKTVAEGVETKAQRDFLVRHDCRTLQGYYVGRPMPADKFEELLHARGSAEESP